MILCASSSYEKKYYLNPDFAALPTQVKNELQSMCVLFTEEVGGVIMLRYDDHGSLMISTQANEGDGLYDEIGAALLVKKLQAEKLDLFESLEMYYELVYLKGREDKKEAPEDEELTLSIMGLDEELDSMTDAELDEYFDELDDEELARYSKYNGVISESFDSDIDPDEADWPDDAFFKFKDGSEDEKDGEWQ